MINTIKYFRCIFFYFFIKPQFQVKSSRSVWLLRLNSMPVVKRCAMYEDEICFLMVWLNTHDSCSSWRNNRANTDGAKLKMNYRTQKLGHYSSPTEPKHNIGHRLEDRDTVPFCPEDQSLLSTNYNNTVDVEPSHAVQTLSARLKQIIRLISFSDARCLVTGFSVS